MLVKEWARLEGLHPQTVWKWCRQGAMPVPVEQTPTGMWLIHDPKYETMPQSKSMGPRTVCYARVSSGDQKNDLQRQADRLKAFALGMGVEKCVLMLLYIVKRLGVLFWVGDGVDPLDGPLLEFGKVACAAFDLADAARGHAERLADLLLGDVPADA